MHGQSVQYLHERIFVVILFYCYSRVCVCMAVVVLLLLLLMVVVVDGVCFKALYCVQ